MTTGEADGVKSGAQGRLGTVRRGEYRLGRVLGSGGMAVVVFNATLAVLVLALTRSSSASSRQ